jgi:hypothetical protein
MIMINEKEGMWKEVVADPSTLLFWNLLWAKEHSINLWVANYQPRV